MPAIPFATGVSAGWSWDRLALADRLWLLVLGAVVVAALASLAAIGFRAWREQRELRRINEARRLARAAHQNLREGLKTMAAIVPDLGPSSLDLSARAMDLLDRQSALLMAVRHARKSWRRGRPALLGRLREMAEIDRTFEGFQQAVLTAVYAQAAQRVDVAPLATFKYNAVFTVLEHRLPARLWPMMNRILSEQVRLWVRKPGEDWKPARRTGVRYGREFIFSRKNLERAVALRLVVGETAVSEFTVEHGVK